MGNSYKLLQFLLVKGNKFTCISIPKVVHTKIALRRTVYEQTTIWQWAY